jgi:hypothetical protein
MLRTALLLAGLFTASSALAADHGAKAMQTRDRVQKTIDKINARAGTIRAQKEDLEKTEFERGFNLGYAKAKKALAGHTAHPGSPFAKEARQPENAIFTRELNKWRATSDRNGWDSGIGAPYLRGYEEGGRLAAYEKWAKWVAKNNPSRPVESFQSVFKDDPLR